MPPAAHENPPVIVRDLVRRFGSVRAVDGVDLEVRRGALAAIVGANGAGKTTTVRILTGLIRADEGTVRILGREPWRDGLSLRREMGVVPDFPVLYDVLTPRENLVRIAGIRGLARDERDRRIEQLAAPLSLEDRLDRPVSGLSKGERKKTALLAAMLHGPAVLFLDEPFEGIDPVSSRAILDMLDALRARGVTVLLTSHILPLVEAIATDVAVMDAGRVVARGSTEEVVGGAPSLEHAVLERLGARRDVPELEWYRPA